jgi:hypothetical protein
VLAQTVQKQACCVKKIQQAKQGGRILRVRV